MKKNLHSLAQLRHFLCLWASQGISTMGTEMTNYALVIWAYEQTGSAASLTTLTLCAFMPTILFRFAAGAAADRWNRKVILLVADLLAACGSLAILGLHSAGSLTVMWLYGINFLLSLMNAFQVPAAYVTTSLLVPPAHYNTAGGLQTASGALISILSPVLGCVVLAWGGMPAVLAVDLVTFALAFLTLCLLPIPSQEKDAVKKEATFRESLAEGFRFLRRHPTLLRLMLLIALVNLLAKLGADGQMAAFILSRTDNSRPVLGAVQSAVALGILAGGMLVPFLKPPTDDTLRILVSCMLVFLMGICMAVSRHPVLWCLTAFLQYLFAAVMNVYWGTKMRVSVPIGMQGRVFSARDTLQNCTIPLGLYLGGILTDRVFEPVMAVPSVIRHVFSPIVGSEGGAGIALLFLLVSVIGFSVCGSCAIAHQCHSSKQSE